MEPKDIDRLCINTLRMLAVDMVEKANSGHPGMPLGAAPMAYVLWSRFMKFQPEDPRWPDRDRFVLSAGHGSALLYAILHMTGHDISMDELKNFRQWGSRTPGHPEYAPDCGVECTTGPLGQGMANGVGMAIAERHLAAVFNRPGHGIVDHYTYSIMGDGDLMEGISSEAASIAGHLKLGRLIYLYDDNKISLAAETRITFTEDACARFEAMGWHVQRVADGNDLNAIESAIAAAKAETERPSIISVRTHIGFGSPNKQDTFEAHGSPLGPEEAALTRKNLGWPSGPAFLVPDEARAKFAEFGARGRGARSTWDALMESYRREYPELAAKWDAFISGRLPDGWDRDMPVFAPDAKGMATRVAGGKVMNAIAPRLENIVGGSADLDPSTKTALKGRGSFHPEGSGDDTVQGSEKGAWSYAGANMAFGVREHAMGAVAGGMAYHGGLIPYASTFLIFSDYMRPAIRLAALSGIHVVYVFTHDSVMLGEDGPTHQPVEHIMSLRAIPGLTVIRPADANETAEAWRATVTRKNGPVALILSRQDLPTLDRAVLAPASGLHKGAYVLADAEGGNPELIIIATGSEVHPALAAREALGAEGRKVRVVCMPSWEMFEEQAQSYRESVLPPGVTRRITVEAGTTLGWQRYSGSSGIIIGMDRFGASAPGAVNREKFGFTADNILVKARGMF